MVVDGNIAVRVQCDACKKHDSVTIVLAERDGLIYPLLINVAEFVQMSLIADNWEVAGKHFICPTCRRIYGVVSTLVR